MPGSDSVANSKSQSIKMSTQTMKLDKVLVGAKPKKFMVSKVRALKSKGKIKFPSLDAVRETYNKRAEVFEQSYNLSKKCACGKANAINLTTCNSCGAGLPENIDRTDNIMYAFVMGAKNKISIRYQGLNQLVYDDFLQLSRCHLNVIPTDCFITDLRFLLPFPKQGLNMILGLEKSIKDVLKKDFFSNGGFMKKMFGKVGTKEMSEEEIFDNYVLFGLNCPPSQYLLHVQAILLPLMPYQYYMYQMGNHFTKNRWFPLEYVKQILTMNKPMQVNTSTGAEDVISFFRKLGIDYDVFHQREYSKVAEAQNELQSWREDDFSGFYDPVTKEFTMFDELAPAPGPRWFEADKEVLKCYDDENLGFYQYPLKSVMKPFPPKK